MRRALALVSALSTTGAAALSFGFGGCGSDVTGTAPAPADDAAPETSDLDASIADDTPLDASAVDTAPPDVGTHQTYCGVLSDSAHPPHFCDDFDDHDATNAWDQATFVPGIDVLDEDATQFVSAPLSVIMQTPALAAAENANVHLRTTLVNTIAHPVYSFEARFSQTAFTEGSVAIASLVLDSGGAHSFTLYFRDVDAVPPGPALYEIVNGNGYHHKLAAVPDPNTWVNTVIDLDLTNGKANLTFGATKALVDEPIQTVVGTEATFRIGAVYMTGPLPAFTANFDNVIFDY